MSISEHLKYAEAELERLREEVTRLQKLDPVGANAELERLQYNFTLADVARQEADAEVERLRARIAELEEQADDDASIIGPTSPNVWQDWWPTRSRQEAKARIAELEQMKDDDPVGYANDAYERRIAALEDEVERLRALYDSEVAQHNRDILEVERLRDDINTHEYAANEAAHRNAKLAAEVERLRAKLKVQMENFGRIVLVLNKDIKRLRERQHRAVLIMRTKTGTWDQAVAALEGEA